jgi:hypothetical protein
MTEESELYEKVIFTHEAKAYQLRLVVNEFRGINYLHIRKYFLDYEGTYQASREGISMEVGIDNIYALLDGLLEIVSKEEAIEAFSTHFSTRIIDLQKPLV